jgi:hypothetical protein
MYESYAPKHACMRALAAFSSGHMYCPFLCICNVYIMLLVLTCADLTRALGGIVTQAIQGYRLLGGGAPPSKPQPDLGMAWERGLQEGITAKSQLRRSAGVRAWLSPALKEASVSGDLQNKSSNEVGVAWGKLKSTQVTSYVPISRPNHTWSVASERPLSVSVRHHIPNTVMLAVVRFGFPGLRKNQDVLAGDTYAIDYLLLGDSQSTRQWNMLSARAHTFTSTVIGSSKWAHACEFPLNVV